jgi:hypothetical protein
MTLNVKGKKKKTLNVHESLNIKIMIQGSQIFWSLFFYIYITIIVEG